ncbi:MAG: ABC transporter permease [Haliscomenobacter sp.]|nr:ABC transporter permease [Haliscomenobacter sp.]MBK9487444.1 ABC transporter permease [Haliscomenobacter sp.]
MKLFKYIIKRLLWGALVLLFVSFFSFLVIQLPPGDFLSSYIARLEKSGMAVDNQSMVALRHSYGLDQPFIVQYGKWFYRFVRGDMGVSFLYTKKVESVIVERLPATLLLSFTSLLVIYLVSIPVGIYSARRQYSIGDFLASLLGFMGMAIPGFLLALILMWIAYQGFGISIGGLQSPQFMDQPMSMAKAIDFMKHLPVPIIVITVAGTAALIRTMRATLLDELGKQYVTTARAKGLKESTLIHKYPVRAAMNPIISSGGWLLPELFSGETIAAIVLGLPTIGPLLYRALLGEDMYLAAGCIMILSILTIIGLLISDIVLAITDPRIRLG